MAQVTPTCPKCGNRLMAHQTRRDKYGEFRYRIRICENDKCRYRMKEYAEPKVVDADRLKRKGIHVRPVGPGMLKLINEALAQGE